MGKSTVFCLALAAFVLSAGTVSADERRWWSQGGRGGLWAGAGIWEGDVTYTIGGHVTDSLGSYDLDFPISELKFPLNDVPLVTAGGNIFLSARWELQAEFAQGSASYAGKMKDSDWTIPGIPADQRPYFKTIYSESDSSAKTFRGDAVIRYWFENDDIQTNRFFESSFEYALGAGFLYESFSWNVSNLDQWYPLFPFLPHDTVTGLVGTYAAAVEVPYVELAGKVEEESYMFSVALGYSPFARVYDEDNHILRSLCAKARTQGDAFKGSIVGRYCFTRAFFCRAQADCLFVNTAGTADTVVYGGADAGQTWTIDHKVAAANYTLSFSLGLRY